MNVRSLILLLTLLIFALITVISLKLAAGSGNRSQVTADFSDPDKQASIPEIPTMKSRDNLADSIAIPEIEKHVNTLPIMTVLRQSMAKPTIGMLTGTSVGGRDSQFSDEDESEAGGPYDAAMFRNLQLQDEHGNIPIDGLLKAKEQMQKMSDAQAAWAKARGLSLDQMKVAGLSPSSWRPLGPNDIGGRIRAIAIDTTNPNKMWVGSVSGGIWHSTDAGASWQVVDDFMANLSISSIVIDPTNPNVMYAGTGEIFGGSSGYQGLGVFKSTNGGLNWTQLSSTNPAGTNPDMTPVCSTGPGPNCPWTYVNRLAISPDGATLLAGTVDGAWRSNNGGQSWVKVAFGPILYIAFDPTNSQNAIISSNHSALYSTNGGTLGWQTSTFLDASGAPTTITGRVELAYAPSDPSIVYASVNQNFGEVYRSTNGGQTYTKIIDDVATPTSSFLGKQGEYDNTIWVNPIDRDSVVVGGPGAYRTFNAQNRFQTNWQLIGFGGPGCEHADHHVIVASPLFNNTTNRVVYFGTDGGLYRADDIATVIQNPDKTCNGWTNLNNGLAITQFYRATSNSVGVIIGGTQDNGTPRYPLGGPWTKGTGSFSGDGGFAVADPTDINYFYGDRPSLEITRSTDGGVTASDIWCDPAQIVNGVCTSSTGITEACGGDSQFSCPTANFLAPIVLDPNDPNKMLAGGQSLWRSNNVKSQVPTWSVIKPADPIAPVAISAIAISATNSDLIVIGQNDGQIWISQDGSSSTPHWSRISDNLTDTTGASVSRFVERIVIDETRSPNRIYVTFGGYSSDNIYVSNDLGTVWKKKTGTGSTRLPSAPVYTLAINPVNRDFLYAATEVGLFASEDGGVTWQLPQGGPANVSVNDLFFQNGNLFAATFGRGVWATTTGVFDLPMCTQSAGCPCAGRTDCPCSYPNNQLPTPTDDVYIACPMTGPGIQVRNLRVESRLDLENGNPVNVSGDIINDGLIDTLPGASNGLFATNIFNTRPQHQVTEKGTITLNGNIFATGDVQDGGVITVTGELSANNLSVAASDGSLGPNAGLSANFIDIKGSIFNNGTITASGSNGGISVASNGVTNTHLLSGNGTWQATGLFGVGDTTQIGNVMTINAKTFSIGAGATFKLQSYNMVFNGESFEIGGSSGVGGTLDVGSAILYFNGTNHFYASTPSFSGDLGSVIGTGTVLLQPADGSADFRDNVSSGLFQPNLQIKSGTIDAQSVFVGGNLVVDQGARLNLNGGTSTVQGNVAIDGTVGKAPTGTTNTVFNFNGPSFTNNGSFLANTLQFNFSGVPLTQQLAGTGTWPNASRISFGTVGSPSTVTLMNDVTLNHDRLSVVRDSVLDLQDHTLTYTGADASPLATVQGTGTFKMSPPSGPANVEGTINSAFRTSTGTVSAGALTANGTFNVDAGSVLAISTNSGSISTTGNVVIDGTINGNGRSFGLNGNNSFTNNGTVNSTFLTFGSGGGPLKNQHLDGAGAWTGSSGWISVGSESTTTLTSDVTYTGPQLFIDGKLNTDTFTFTLPCPATWQGAGDIVGNIRRTNLSTCSGRISFGNPNTSINFLSGTRPTEATVHVTQTPPPNFPNALGRFYVIDTVGGSGFTATLRLHYLDSELNGNDENNLFLFRYDGTQWNGIGATARDTVNNWVEFAGVTQFSPWTLSSTAAPTAAPVTVGGRVTLPGGGGVANVRVTVTSTAGIVRSAVTNNFGYFRVEDVPTGQTYIVNVNSRKYSFDQPSRVINVLDEIDDLNFIAHEN